MKKSSINIKPFVKWAGGKGQLLPEIRKKYPLELGKTITQYCEPFVGGGAVLFDILSNFPLKEVLINDINSELINAYKQVQNHVSELIEQLENMQNLFWSLNMEKRKKFYLEKRNRFNYLKLNGDENVNIEKAALLIFLNKTCFNGLFRVNKKGFFNVPMGAYKKPLICDRENLLEINKLLQNVNILCGDYKHCLNFIDHQTFVYIDPPYRPLSKTANFTAYSENLFDDKEQLLLGQFVDLLNEKGTKVLISNSDPKNADENDTFFDDLYKSYHIERVQAKRVINSNGRNRGHISELLISKY